MLEVGNVHPSGKGMNGKVYWAEEEMTTLTTNKGEGQKIAVRQATSKGYDLCRLGGRHGKSNRSREYNEKGESG